MRLTHRLLRHTSGVFHFRLIVPADLRSRLGRSVIKRSLRTHHAHAALLASMAMSARYADLFAQLRGGAMPTEFDLESWLSSDLPGRRTDFKIDLKSGTVETDGTLGDAEAAMAMAKQMTAYAQATAPVAPKPATADANGLVVGVTLRTAIDHWETMDMPQLASSTQSDYKATIESFAAHVGEKRLIASIAKPDVSHWVAHLKSTLGNSQGTAKKKIGAITALFESAKRAGFFDEERHSPSDRAVKFTKSDQAKRAETHGWQAFRAGQLAHLFAPENLARTREIHTRRAMVIALYTGARVGEIAQLRLDGFGEEEGQQFMTLKGDLKTEASKRRIPLHPDLIELGLWDWVADQKRRGFTRLFPTVKLDGKSGKGNAISKGCENLLKRLDIKPTIDLDLAETRELDPILGMHSFRDTIIQALQTAKVNIELRKAYVGHAYEKADKSDSHKVAYMRAWTPKEIADVFEGIQFGWWLQFDALKAVLLQSDEEHAQAMRTKEQREVTRARTAAIEAKRAADAKAAEGKAIKLAAKKNAGE